MLALILDRARRRVGQRQRTLDRLLSREHLALHVLGETLALCRVERLRGDAACTKQRDERRAERAPR